MAKKESNPIKLHLCCGDVYLLGYVNVDIVGLPIKLATDKQFKDNVTTLEHYFKYPFGTPRREIITDAQFDLLEKWPLKKNSVKEIVMISCIEHFTQKEAKWVIKEIQRVLQPGGKLIIDFPNLAMDFMKYYFSDPEFLMELIYCNHKNQYSVHKWGYTFNSFKKLLGPTFLCVKKTIVKHDYPMIGVVATKLSVGKFLQGFSGPMGHSGYIPL